jgi:hypothetical protein
MGDDVLIAATKIANEFHCSPDLVKRATSHFQRQLSTDMIFPCPPKKLLTEPYRRGTISEWSCDKLYPVACHLHAQWDGKGRGLCYSLITCTQLLTCRCRESTLPLTLAGPICECALSSYTVTRRTL